MVPDLSAYIYVYNIYNIYINIIYIYISTAQTQHLDEWNNHFPITYNLPSGKLT